MNHAGPQIIRRVAAGALMALSLALVLWWRGVIRPDPGATRQPAVHSGRPGSANVTVVAAGTIDGSWQETARKLFGDGHAAAEVLRRLMNQAGFRLTSGNLLAFLELALPFDREGCVELLRENSRLVDVRDAAWESLLARMARAIPDVESAVRFAVEFLHGESQARFVYDKLEHLPETNLRAALRSFELLPDGNLKQSIAGRIANQMAMQVPAKEAVGWLEKLMPPELQYAAVANYIGGINRNPKYSGSGGLTAEQFDALEAAFSLASQPAVIGQLGDEIVRGVADSAPDQIPGLLQWIEDQSPERRDVLKMELGKRMASSDIELALKLVSSLEDPQQQSQGVAAIAGEMAYKSPQKALDWAAAIPDAEMSRVARSFAVSQWTRMDAAAAMAWALKIPLAEDRERLLGHIAITAAASDTGKDVARELLKVLKDRGNKAQVERILGQ